MHCAGSCPSSEPRLQCLPCLQAGLGVDRDLLETVAAALPAGLDLMTLEAALQQLEVGVHCAVLKMSGLAPLDGMDTILAIPVCFECLGPMASGGSDMFEC